MNSVVITYLLTTYYVVTISNYSRLKEFFHYVNHRNSEAEPGTGWRAGRQRAASTDVLWIMDS